MVDNKVDLSIFDDEVPSVQPVELTDNKVDLSIFDDEVPTSAVLSEAARVNPDQQVKINQLARDTGIPVDDVAVDPLGVEADHRAKKVASEDFTAHPSTGKFLSDFDKAAIAHDDVGVLKKLETSLKAGAGILVDAHLTAADKGVRAAKWVTHSFEGSGDNFIRRMEMAGKGIVQASSEGDGTDYSKLLPEQIAMAKALGVEDTSSSEFIARTAKVNERIATLHKEISENTPRDLDIGQKMLRGGVESVMVSTPGLIASLATRSATPAIVSAGTFTFGDSYAEGRRSGLSHDDALLYGSVDSIIEMGTEYGPTKILGSVLDGGDLKKKILKYAATELLGEQVATAGQTTNAVLNGIDEEWNNAATLEEKIKLQAERQLITLGSTVVAGSIQAGGVGGLRKTIDHFAKKRDEEISQFQVDQTTIDSIAVDANNSELRRRDADSFHQFMSQADGDNNTHVFIDGVQAKLYLDTLEDKESPAVKLLAAGINDAAALGSDVVIPIADFATHIAGTEHFTALREFMNLNGTAPSPFRLKQSQDETETLMTDLMTRANENVSQYVESQQIFDTVKQQLIDTGRINSKNADVMARIVPAWATVFARDNGLTIQQAYEQSGLVIQGPQTGEAARMGAELDALRQSFSTAMDSVKSLGEVVKEGKPDSVLGESIVLKFDNAQVQASIREDENNVYLTSIAAKKLDDLAEVATGTGRGTSVIDQLKKYADQTGKRLAVVDSTKSAKSYYDKISYLKQDDVTLDFDGEAYTPPISFTYTPATPSKFNQFVGANAQGVPMAELDRAKHMREQGLGNNAIQRDTGWFMGVDGKWRYEISDHEAEWSVKPLEVPDHMEILNDVSRELFGVSYGALPLFTESNQRDEVLALADEHLRKYRTVGGMLNHSVLFKAYPSLRNINLVFEKMDDNEGGYYDVKTNTIAINDGNTSAEQLSTLMHELQHSIQELEDFARGGAPSKPFADSVKAVLQRLDADMTNKLDTWDYRNQWKFKTVDKAAELSRNALMYQSYKRLIEYSTRDKPSGVFRHILNESQWIYDDKFRGNREANDLQRKFYDMPRSGPKRQEAARDIAFSIGVFLKSQIPEAQITMFENDTRTMTGMIKALSREATKAKELLKPRQELVGKAKRAALVAGVSKFKTPHDIYLSLGGEIEARITQKRMKLTPEQRRVRSIATDDEIPMSEAIVLMGGMELAVPVALSKSAPESFEQQSRGYYEPANSLIRLTEASNLSTFMHEFAHFMYEMELKSNGKKLSGIHNWFKRNAVDVAKEANEVIAKQTPDFTRASLVVTPSDVTLYLDNGTTGDANIDTAIRVATHEQFARGWEAYIMEGKSPSIELRNVFRVMAQWMVEIYKSIRGLNVKLDDEMRKVLDTMVATEEQIKMAEARARFAPLFTDAAAAGMTEAEFAAYKERVEKTQGTATETLRDKLIAQITRTKKQEWKEEKQDLIDTELNALKALPVYKAIDALRNGEFKLDHATVKELYGVEKTDARGITSTRIPSALNNMTAKGATGVHPDEAAAFFGYGSGAEMIDAITKAKPIGEAAAERAEAIMVERHGDILNDGSIEKESDDAVQNEERGRLILAELKVLSRGQRSIDRDVIRGLAEETIGKMSYRQIHPNKYRNAEIKAAMEAASMFAKGNMEGAAAAKARQVMNYFLAMEATAAQNNITKIVDSMSRYNKKEVREEIMKAENGYWEQIVKILERFEFRKSATLTSVEQHNQDINTWANERMSLDGDGLVLSPAVLNELYKDHWKNVKYNDLQGVSDSVKNIEHVARYSNKMNVMGEEITFKKLVNKLVDHWSALPQRFHAQRTTIDDADNGRHHGRWIMGQMTKIPYLMSWLDGGERIGLSHQVFVQRFNDAKHNKVGLWKQYGEVVMKAIENRSKEDIKRHNSKVFIEEIKTDKLDGNLWGRQVLAVALNTGNAGNLRKMLLGEGWANPENDAEITINNPKLQAVLKHMTESDWKLVQLIWDQMDQLYPMLADTHRRTTGLTPPKVEATPVVTPWGTFAGGYYPLKRDPKRSHEAALSEERADAQVDSMFSTDGSIQASVNASATNERNGSWYPIRFSLDVVPNHFEEVIHFITHHDAVREVNKLIRNKEIAESIKATMGPEEYAQLKPWLNDIAKDGREARVKTWVEKFFGRMRTGTTLGMLGFKLMTIVMQTSGLLTTTAEVGPAAMMKSYRMIFGGEGNVFGAWEFASANSKTLSHRAVSMDREIANVMSKLRGKPFSVQQMQKTSMMGIAYMQTYIVDLPSWYAGYLKAMKEHGDEQRAYQYGDWVVEQIQGSGLTKDMAALFRNQNEVLQTLTMFMTPFSALWNAQRDMVKGAKSGKYSVSELAARGMFFMVLPALFSMIARGEFDDDDDWETTAEKIAFTTALYSVSSVPVLRDAASKVVSGYDYMMSPVASIIGKGLTGIVGLYDTATGDKELSGTDVKNATKGVAAFFGIPGTSQAFLTGEHAYDVLVEGEDLAFRELLLTPAKKQ